MLIRAIGFSKQARSIVKDFLAGVDPVGIKTTQYGEQDARAGKHSPVRAAVGAVGGVIGGGIAVPSAIFGVIGASKGLIAGKGLSGKLIGAGNGFVTGFKRPVTELYHAHKATSAIGRVRAGGASISGAERESMKRVARSVNLGSFETAKATFLGGGGGRIWMNGPRARLLESAHSAAKSKLREVQSGLALGGAVGGVSAALQYYRGPKTESRIRERIKTEGQSFAQKSGVAP